MKLHVSLMQRRRRMLLRFGSIFLVLSQYFNTVSTAAATTTPGSETTGTCSGYGANVAMARSAIAVADDACHDTFTTREPCLSSSSCRALDVSQLSVFLQSPPRGGGGEPPPKRDDDWDDNNDNDPRKRRNSRPSTNKESSSSSSSSLLSRLAKTSAKLSGQAISATARGSGQVAYALLRPKHVEYPELIGLWRLDQWIEDDDDDNNDGHHHHHHDERRTLELTEQCTVLFSRPPSTTSSTTTRDATSKQQHRHRQQQVPLEFHPAHWPSLATLSFYDDTTRLYYKCTVQRKMADPKVLKLRGKIYKILPHRGGFWQSRRDKNRRDQQVTSLASIQKKDLIQIGTFVGRRRLKLLLTDDDDDDDTDDKEQDEESDWEESDADYDGGDEINKNEEEGLNSERWNVNDEEEEEGTGMYDNDEEEDSDI